MLVISMPKEKRTEHSTHITHCCCGYSHSIEQFALLFGAFNRSPNTVCVCMSEVVEVLSQREYVDFPVFDQNVCVHLDKPASQSCHLIVKHVQRINLTLSTGLTQICAAFD